MPHAADRDDGRDNFGGRGRGKDQPFFAARQDLKLAARRARIGKTKHAKDEASATFILDRQQQQPRDDAAARNPV